MLKLTIILLLASLPCIAFSQITQSIPQNKNESDSVTIFLFVYENETNRPMAYSHVVTSSKKGFVTDSEGRSTCKIHSKDSLTISYTGFLPVTIGIPQQGDKHLHITVPLSEKRTFLKEIEIRPFPSNVNEFKAAVLELGTYDYRTDAQKYEDVFRKNMDDYNKKDSPYKSIYNYDKVPMDAREINRYRPTPTIGMGIYKSKRDKELAKLKKIIEKEKQAKLKAERDSLTRMLQGQTDSLP